MWYEVIPSFGIVVGLLAIPNLANCVLNWTFRSRKVHCRDWDASQLDYMLYLRDRTITGSEYKPRGLESIPKIEECHATSEES
ncbi:Hypothetical predicted protein [Octopus vulgaris]|uniref:NADH dehydrogenase [ubiquinone] 1 alpha subcomplex subunit 1 n=1 Tax=Octopus vulgaris TaxID=6645 RepID=A0AA36B2P5_OCTVU|nr:Hypothetical predicted protein [Octopus vulgaris]